MRIKQLLTSSLRLFGWCFVLCLISTHSWGQGDGYCSSGNCQNGYGTFFYIGNGTKYVGEFWNGQRHGQGTMIRRNGGQNSSGQWINGEFFHQNNDIPAIQSEKNINIRGLQVKKLNCTTYGFVPNTDAHAQCVMQLAIAEEAQAVTSSSAARTQAAAAAQAATFQRTLRVRQEAQAAALKEAEESAERQRNAELLMRMGGSISRGCGAFGC